MNANGTSMNAEGRLARRALLINAICMVVFALSVLGLEANAGYLPWIHSSGIRGNYFKITDSVFFWITVFSIIPLCDRVLTRSRKAAVARSAGAAWYSALARAEVTLWFAIWIGFLLTFWSAITCGLHIYGFPSPVHWPHDIGLWLKSVDNRFVHWVAGHLRGA